jgi:hypothetical protein
VKGAATRSDFLLDPRRGDWIYTRNNFTRPKAAVPLAADFTSHCNGVVVGSARLGRVVIVGSARRINRNLLLVGTVAHDRSPCCKAAFARTICS